MASLAISEHEKRYTPSQYSKRYGPDEIIEEFKKMAINVTERARSEIKCQLDVSYGSSERTKYDIYGTDLPQDAPIFVFIHGGYWQELSKDYAGFPVFNFVENGIKVITISYDLCPQVKLADIVLQIRTATEQILKYASESGSRCVWIAGHSAGAHLAVGLLYDEEWVNRMTQKGCFQLIKCIMLIGGIYNLRPLTQTSFNDLLQLTQSEIESLSFSSLKTKKCVQGLKVIVTVGECDSPVFVNESREYAQKLIETVDNVEYILLRDDIDHFNIVENFVKPDYVLNKIVLRGMAAK